MKDQKLKRIILHFGLSFCILIFAFCIFGKAEAAILYFSPSSGNFTIGNIFTVSVLVNTDSKTINNSDAVINFPADLLEVVSLTKSASIFSLWVEESAFSNSAGTISFNGGLPTPGFNGTAGNILNAVFRVKSVGTASVVFSSGAVRANDGYGTDILKVRSQATYNLIAEEKAPPPAIVVGTPPKPEITSSTHPDSEKWYSNSTATFTWPVSKDVTAVRVLVGKNPVSVPVVLYTPPITEKTVENLEDGVWYFHVGLKNNTGWGETAHFRFQIDTTPPKPFSIEFPDGKETDNPQPLVLFDTTDSLSGIDYYKVRIGEGDYFRVSPDEVVASNPYKLLLQAPGKRTILVQAYDKAGNYNMASEEFVIKPIASPRITDYPSQLENDGVLIIKGETYPNSQVDIWLQREKDAPKKQTVRSDGSGNFVFVAEEKLRDGIYKLWTEAIDQKGARSYSSETITIAVEKPAFLKIGSWAINILTIAIPLIALVTLLLIVLWYGWHKLSRLRKKIKKEVREAEEALHKAFDLLHEDIREQIKLLEKTKTKRQLTEEEEEIIKRLKKDLDDAEKFVRKEIEDIEKEVK